MTLISICILWVIFIITLYQKNRTVVCWRPSTHLSLPVRYYIAYLQFPLSYTVHGPILTLLNKTLPVRI